MAVEAFKSKPPAIAVRDVMKRYGHVEALRGVSLSVNPGEIVALVGDNGAGKSTLVKIVCGAVAADSGTVELSGRHVETETIGASSRRGLGMVYQDLALAPDLRVYENVFLGHEKRRAGFLGRLGFLNRAAMAADARTAIDSIAPIRASINAPVRDLSGGQRQMVAIARAVHWCESAVIMDEPTASLGVKQTVRVGEIITQTAQRGIAVLLVSHDMPHVLKIADRIVVLRHGLVVADLPAGAGGTTIADVVATMLGQEATAKDRRSSAAVAE